MPTTETRDEALTRWEREGWLDRGCKGCEEFYAAKSMPWEVWAPRHEASAGCRSGKTPHCTCDTCF